MYEIISISCSLAGQPILSILEAFEKIKVNHPEATLFHTFPVNEEFSEIQGKLEELFPKKEVWRDGVGNPLRKALAKSMARRGHNAKAYFIGELRGEALAEYHLFANAGVKNAEIVKL